MPWNNNGEFDTGESLLVDNNEANIALTGGILDLAQRLYFVRYNEWSQRYTGLKNSEFILYNEFGFISSIYDVNSIDGTPFSVTPAGLLLDMVGTLQDVWKADVGKARYQEGYTFTGHISSALEHEIWQEITGNDAYSTLRVFQLLASQGDTISHVHNAPASALDNMNGTAPNKTIDEFKASLGSSHELPGALINQMETDLVPNSLTSYTLPTRMLHTENNNFYAYMKNYYISAGDFWGTGYMIGNLNGQANGGIAESLDPAKPAPESIKEETGHGKENVSLNSIANNDTKRGLATVDPVSTVTGNMYHDETDFIIAGKGLNYTFTRTYNSNETKVDGPDSLNPNYLPLSQGWTHSYNMKLVTNDYGENPRDTALAENTNNKTSSIVYFDERAGESTYLLDDANASSQPTPPAMKFDNLVINSPSVGLHTLNFANGNSYTFDSNGADIRTPGTAARLHKIADPYGHELNFSYTGSQLTSITDNLNISSRTGLTLSYIPTGEHQGRLQSVSDWTGRSWQYAYIAGRLTGVTNPLAEAMAYTYAGDTHQLKDIIQPQNRNGKKKTMTFSYYANGQAFNYVDKNGSAESLSYDLYRNTTRVTNPNGNSYAHHYDDKGALLKLERADKGILLFENNEDGLRYVKYDPLGYRTRFSYNTDENLTGAASNTQGLVTLEEDALGNVEKYSYGIYNQNTSYTDKNGKRITNYFSTTNDPTIGALAGKLKYTVADNIEVDGVTLVNARLAGYSYYPDGTVKQKIESTELESQTNETCFTILGYERCFDLTVSLPTSTRTTDYTYTYATDGSYIIDSIVSTPDTDDVTVKQSFDNLWRLTSSSVWRKASATDATLIELTTSYEYDSLSRVVKSTDPMGNISETVYDHNGKVYQKIARYALTGINDSPKHEQCSVDAAYPSHHSCLLLINNYDVADRLISSTDVMGATTTFKHDAMGNITIATNHLGNSLYYEYDNMERRTKVTNENGYAVSTQYDLAGNVIALTDANNHIIRYTYDALGRVKTTTSPEGRVTNIDQYDGNGNALRMSDANSSADANISTVTNVFDGFNRLKSSLNLEGETTRFTYDLFGNKTSVIDALNQTTIYNYNGLGQLVSVVDPIIETPTDKTVSITYDELGNRLTYTDRLGEVTRYQYDKLNRATMEEYLADDITAIKVYNQYGDLIRSSYGDVTYSYEYDAAHRLLKKTDSRNNQSMSWKYNIIGSLIEKTTYQGEVYKYSYSSSNRLVSMSIGEPVSLQASYHYDPAGRLLSRILSNGASTVYSYSDDGFLTLLKQLGADGIIIDTRRYQHDSIGNISKLTINGSEVIDYGYDNAYRLLTVNSNNNSHDFAYTYDEVGNRKTKTANGVVHHYVHGAGNRLNTVNLNSATGSQVYRFEYDDNGSMIKKYNSANQEVLDVSYDQRRLASFMGVANPAADVSFKYDANLYRIQKQQDSATKKYLLEGEHMEAIYNASDELQASYLRGAVVDEVITGFEKNDNGIMQSRTFHHDQVNSVVALSDHNGAIKQSLSYGPFGEALTTSGSSHNAMQYTGREQDSESGLYYYRARYYDPEMGRFISEDPIGFKGGVNFYAYVGNNPLIYNDPSGNLRSRAGLFRDSVKVISSGAGVVYGAGAVAGGTALSSTFAGAIVGVPLIAGGAVVYTTSVDGASEALTNIYDNFAGNGKGETNRISLKSTVLGESPSNGAILAYDMVNLASSAINTGQQANLFFEGMDMLSKGYDIYDTGKSGVNYFDLEVSDLSGFSGTPGQALGFQITERFGTIDPVPNFSSDMKSLGIVYEFNLSHL